MKNPWRTLSQRIVYKNAFGFRLREDAVIDPSGQPSTYMVLEGGDFVTIVAITTKKELAFVHQWRYPLEQSLLELPAGHINSQESPLHTAKRELREEVGGTAPAWSHLAALWACVGATKTRNHIFLARGLVLGLPPQLDSNESLSLRLIPYDQALLWASTGVIQDEKSVAALLLADHYLRTHNLDS